MPIHAHRLSFTLELDYLTWILMPPRRLLRRLPSFHFSTRPWAQLREGWISLYMGHISVANTRASSDRMR